MRIKSCGITTHSRREVELAGGQKVASKPSLQLMLSALVYLHWSKVGCSARPVYRDVQEKAVLLQQRVVVVNYIVNRNSARASLCY